MLRADDLVYRVNEDIPHDEAKPFTWRMVSAVVASASTKQIALKTYFPGLFRKQFNPHALGSVFFETPLRAIQHFLAAQHQAIEVLDRRRKEAERAIAWAASQGGVAL